MTREDAIRIIDLRSTCRECVVSGYDCDDCDSAFAMAIEALKQQKTGRWIDKDEGIARCSARCSCCEKESSGFATDNGFSFDYSYHDYCPKCGAKMENPKEV